MQDKPHQPFHEALLVSFVGCKERLLGFPRVTRPVNVFGPTGLQKVRRVLECALYYVGEF